MRTTHRAGVSALVLAVGLSATVAVTAGPPGDAEPRATTSRLTGVALPEGVQRVEDADTAAGVLRQLDGLAQERGLQARRVEMLAWPGKGDATAAARVTEAVTTRLRAAGYEYVAAEPQRNEVGLFTTFAALAAAKKAGIIGFWVAKDSTLLLAWAELAPRAEAVDPSPAEGPSLATEPPRLPTLEPKPGVVRGRVVNLRGEPLPDAAVLVYGTTFAGGRTQSYPIAATAGRYELEVPDGLYDVSATTRVRYLGADYRLELLPTDGSPAGRKASSKTGIVRDFVLALTGRSSHFESMGPDYHGSYNGGSISIGQRREVSLAQTGELPEGVVTVTLTPVGPLIDGSTGGVLRTRVDFAKVTTGAWYDVPVGRYRVAATLTLKEDGKTYGLTVVVRARAGDEPSPPAESAVFAFAPRGGVEAGTEEVRLELRP